MLLHKLKTPMVLLVMAVVAVSGISLIPSLSPAHLTAAPVPKSLKSKGGLLAVTRGDTVYLLTPDGKEMHVLDVRARLKDERPGQSPHVRPYPSPQGGFPLAVMVAWHRDTGKRGGEITFELRLIRSANEPLGEVVDFGSEVLVGNRVAWARDGKRMYVCCWATDADRKQEWASQQKYLTVNPATGKATTAPIREHHELVGEAADGRLVTMVNGGPETGNDYSRPLYVSSLDGKTAEKLKPFLLPQASPYINFAPDGHTAITRRLTDDGKSDRVVSFDALTGKSGDIVLKELSGEKLNGRSLVIHSARWSPDGQRIGLIYSLVNKHHEMYEVPRALHVCDRDGTNGNDIFTWTTDREGQFEWN